MPGEQEIDFILSDLFFCVKLEKVKYVGRNSDAEHGIYIFVSDAYEYVYLCGFDGICHGESAAVSI